MKDQLENQMIAFYVFLASMPELRPIWYFDEATRRIGKHSVNTDAREVLARYEVEVSGGNSCFYGDRDYLKQPRKLRRKAAKNARIALGVQERNIFPKASAAAKAIGKAVGNNRPNKCMQSGKTEETVEHVVSACSQWLSNLYVERHDAALRVIYYRLANIRTLLKWK
ncbi:unnamed protein product [Enterobius vermicularis]|uniref:Transposase n=1 Tax=Enterobius vermicularis TaxID=51028 RepID=A0A0N4VRN3_ENTVE|nr:unnamed protein product [Enterobius vermicularis]